MKVPWITLLFATSCYAQELVQLKLPKSNKVVIKLMFRNGSVCDPKGKEGLTLATADTLIKGGAANLTYSDIQDRIYPWAARYGAHVDKEVTVFTFEVHVDFFDRFYPILRDLILQPSFAWDDFKRVMANQQNFVDQVIRASSDEEYAKKALEDFLFRGTNYQHMKEGTSGGIRSITLDDVQNHYRQFFTRNNLRIGIAGNYRDTSLQTLKADMARLPDRRPAIPEPGVASTPDGIQVEIIAKEGAFGSAIFTGFPLDLTRSNDEFAALMVANSYLGEHRKSYSKLYEKIREVRSMNYGDFTYIEWYEQGGVNMLPPPGVPRSSNYFAIWIRPIQIAEQLKTQYPELAGIAIGHAHFALRMAIRELDRLVTNGMTPEDFESTLAFLRSYTRLYAQTPDQRLGWLMDSKFYGRSDYLSELDQLLAQVTLEDVNRAIRRHWQTGNMFVTIVTDVSEAAPLAESLRKNLPSPMSYSNEVRAGLPKAVLAEDEEVARYLLNVKTVAIVQSQDTFSTAGTD